MPTENVDTVLDTETRQQKRSKSRKADATRESRIKRMYKPATKLELFAMGQDIDHKITVLDKFLTMKYGKEFEEFVMAELEEVFKGKIPVANEPETADEEPTATSP